MPVTAAQWLRDFVIDGLPSSGANKPSKAEGRELLTALETLATLAYTSSLVYATRAALYANLTPAANVPALVVNDPTPGYDGLYMKVGGTGTGSWLRQGDVPGRQIIRAYDAGAGTPNAIAATTNIQLPVADASALIILNIFEANTGPVTVSFNGGAALPIYSATGTLIASGELPTGIIVAGFVTGGIFRITTDVSSLANKIAAEAAATGAGTSATAAAASAALAAGYASNAVSQGNVPIYATRAGMSAVSVPVGITAIRTNGYATVGDGGQALYKVVSSLPAHPFSFTSADGRHWADVRKIVVIAATGQSNIAYEWAYTWAPAPNAFLWNYSSFGPPVDSVGTAIVPMPTDEIAYGWAFASNFAKDHPDNIVVVINVGFGGRPISSWLVGATAPDMYAILKANIEACLTQLGLTKIDLLLWWQGEADAVILNRRYSNNFDTLQARFRTESWWNFMTRIVMSGYSPYFPDLTVRHFTHVLRDVVAQDPLTRVFVPLDNVPAYLWEPNDGGQNVHMTAAGYEMVAKIAYDTLRWGGPQLGWNRVLKPTTELRQSTTTLAEDAHLHFPMKPAKAYRIRAKILIATANATSGFKWSLTGAGGVIVSGEYLLPLTSTRVVVGAYPGPVSITDAAPLSGYIVFDLVVTLASTTTEFAFNWAQNASHASNTVVYPGSYIEYIEWPDFGV